MTGRATNSRRMVFLPIACLVSAIVLLGLAGCHTDMWVQPKDRPYRNDEFFENTQSARPVVAGTVAHVSNPDELRVGNSFYSGIDPASHKLIDALPDEITKVDAARPGPVTGLRYTLHRGQERFNIYCSPCHGRIGDGKGMIAQRGLALRKNPQNFHADRMRRMPLGHYYDVITNGFGVMYSYAQRVEPDDRWRIAAYIRVLQYSQSRVPGDVPPDMTGQLNSSTPVETAPVSGGTAPPPEPEVGTR